MAAIFHPILNFNPTNPRELELPSSLEDPSSPGEVWPGGVQGWTEETQGWTEEGQVWPGGVQGWTEGGQGWTEEGQEWPKENLGDSYEGLLSGPDPGANHQASHLYV